MTTGFLVIEGVTEGAIRSMHRTQGEADAAARARGTGFNSIRGGREIDYHYPGYSYFDGSAVQGAAFMEAMIRAAMSDAEHARELKKDIHTRADIFDRAYREHHGQRSANTLAWGRGWVGWAWREADRLETDHTDKLTRAQVTAIADQLRAEIPSAEFVLTWSLSHDESAWQVKLFPGGRAPTRAMQKTSLASGRIPTPVAYDPAVSFTDVAWQALQGAQYRAALLG